MNAKNSTYPQILAVIPALNSFYLSRLLPSLDKDFVTTIVVKSKQFELSAETRQAIAETTYLKHDFWEIENETGDLLSVAKACNHGVKCAPQRQL